MQFIPWCRTSFASFVSAHIVFLTLAVCSIWWTGEALAQPARGARAAGVYLQLPGSYVLPFERGAKTEVPRFLGGSAEFGIHVTDRLAIGGVVSSMSYRAVYRYAAEALEVEERLIALGAGPFVRYTAPLAGERLRVVAELKSGLGILTVDGKQLGGRHGHSHGGYFGALEPGAGLEVALAPSLDLTLLARYRAGVGVSEVLTPGDRDNLPPYYLAEGKPRTDFFHGFEVHGGLRFFWHERKSDVHPGGSETVREPGRHAVYVEAAGTGFIYSLNYEHGHGALRPRLGVSFWPMEAAFEKSIVGIAEVSYLFATSTAFSPEVSGGVLLLNQDEPIIPHLAFGLRLERSNWFVRLNGGFFLVDETGDYETGHDAILWPGLSYGRRF